VIAADLNPGIFEVVFLLCIGLCFWKRLWIALGVLGGVIVAANLLFFVADSKGWAVLTAVAGVFFLFPVAVYFNLERREKEDRRRTIRRSRRHTGRE